MFSCLFCSCSVVVQRAAAAAVTALRGLGLSCSPVSRGGSTNQPTNRPSSNCASCRQISAQHNSTLFELRIWIGRDSDTFGCRRRMMRRRPDILHRICHKERNVRVKCALTGDDRIPNGQHNGVQIEFQFLEVHRATDPDSESSSTQGFRNFRNDGITLSNERAQKSATIYL
uniref:Secreted protein n=1 Tax=Globodera rostochiensis TaxID=31243 RepID=A0A914HGL2_GLORO